MTKAEAIQQIIDALKSLGFKKISFAESEGKITIRGMKDGK